LSIGRVTYKGQVTIPKQVREALEIEDGDSVVFVVEEGRAVLYPVKQKSLSAFRGTFKATRPYPGMKAIRAEVHEEISRSVLGNVDNKKRLP